MTNLFNTIRELAIGSLKQLAKLFMDLLLYLFTTVRLLFVTLSVPFKALDVMCDKIIEHNGWDEPFEDDEEAD